MRGHQHRGPGLGHGRDMLPEVPAGARVHARCGLVQKQHRRLVQGGAQQGQALFLPQRQAVGAAVQIVRQFQGPCQHGQQGLAAFRGQAVQLRTGQDVLAHRDVQVQGKFLRHVAQTRTCRAARTQQVHTVHAALARRGPRQAAKHAEGGGLARAVGPQQAEDLAGAHREADVVGRREAAEALGQLLRHDAFRRFHGQPRRLAAALASCPAVGRGLLIEPAHHVHVGVFQTGGDVLSPGLAHGGPRAFRSVLSQQHTDAAALHQGIFHARRPRPAGQGRLAALAARRHMEHAPFHPGGEPLGRAVVEDAAAVQHDDARTARGLVQIGRGPDDGHAVIAQFADHLPQLLPRQGVHAHTGFVQQQHARRPQQGAGDAQFLFHAAGKASGQTAGERPKRGEGQQPVEQDIAGLALQTAQTGVQAQVGHDGKVFIQTETLRHVADAVGGVRRHLAGGTAEQQGLPRRRFHEPGQQAQQGGLARAVRPHEAGDAPGRDAGIQTAQGLHGPEAHDQPAQFHGDAVPRHGGVPHSPGGGSALPACFPAPVAAMGATARRPGRVRRPGCPAPPPGGQERHQDSTRVTVTGMPCRMTLSGSSTCTRRR